MRRSVVCVVLMLGAVLATAQVVPASPPAVLWLAGDLHLGLAPKPVLEPLRGLLQGVGVLNLEGAVAEHPPRAEGLRLHNHPKALGMLKELNVAAVGVDNNHKLDAGRGSWDGTLQHVAGSGLMALAGGGHVARLTVGDTRVVVTQHDLTGGVPRDLGRDLTAAREKDVLLVALFHVSTPDSYLPPPVLKRATTAATEAGAAVVAAHGSHMVGPVVWQGNTLVAYGLGNLAFACDCTREKDAMLLRLHLAAGELRRVDVVPIQAGLNRQPAKPHPDPAALVALLGALGSAPMTLQGDHAVVQRATASAPEDPPR